MIIERTIHQFFDDLITYILFLCSLGLTHELYISGRSGIYAPNHTINLIAKQVGRDLIFFPSSILNQFFGSLKWPTQINFNESGVTIPSHARLQLQTYERPSFTLLLAMFVNFFEKHRNLIENNYGKKTIAWPSVWNFGRVVRNSLAHGGRIKFIHSSSPPVTWRGLTYSSINNGQEIFHTDLWPGDIIYLMIDMNIDLIS